MPSPSEPIPSLTKPVTDASLSPSPDLVSTLVPDLSYDSPAHPLASRPLANPLTLSQAPTGPLDLP